MSQGPNLSLAELQQWMQNQLMEPHAQAGLAPEEVLEDSARLGARHHLAIYQRSYIARLRQCMAEQFSALEYALGPELFEGFADEYLAQHPSRSYNLIDLGAQFEAFLQATRPDADAPEDWPDFMIELAHLEYAIHLLFHQPGEEGYALADDQTPDDQLALVPVMQVFAFRFPIRAFYSQFLDGQQPELPFPQPSYCVVLRHQYQLSMYDLHGMQYHLLQHLQTGKTPHAAMDCLVKDLGADAKRLAEVWPHWKAQWTRANMFRVRQ